MPVTSAVKSQTRVFVSHSSKDREFVEREFIPLLDANGIATWYSKTDINSAADWERMIRDGLKQSDWFMLVMSPNSANSEWVRNEIHWAMRERQNRILPVMIDPCDPDDFHLGIRRIQYVDYCSGDQSARERLLSVWNEQVNQPVTLRPPRISSFGNEAQKAGTTPPAISAIQTPAPIASANAKNGMPIWIFILLGVLGIGIVVFAAVAVLVFSALNVQNRSAAINAAKSEMSTIKMASTQFKLQMNAYPSDLEHLLQPPPGISEARWGGPYMNGDLLDPWGNKYSYVADEANDSIKIRSAGPDGKFNTSDDIEN